MNGVVIEDLNELVSSNYPIEYVQKIIDNVLLISMLVKEDYPDYRNWFLTKQAPGIFDGSRNIIVAHYKENIVGFVSLKKDSSEKKICTFYVAKMYRKNRIGYMLAQRAIEWLECEKPLITIPSDKLWNFIKIAKKYDWIVSDIKDGLYRTNNPEIILNSSIEEESFEKAFIKIKKRSITDIWFFYYKQRIIYNLFKKFNFRIN